MVACYRVRGIKCSSTCMGSFEGGHHYLHYLHHSFSSVQFSSVTQSCPNLCDPMNHSMPGLLVYHQLPEFTQTHVHQVGDAIQPSHPLLSLSPPASIPPSIRVFSLKEAVSADVRNCILATVVWTWSGPQSQMSPWPDCNFLRPWMKPGPDSWPSETARC